MYDKQGKKNHRCVIQNRTNVVFHFSVSLGRGGHDDVKNWAGKARETVWRTQQNDRKEKQTTLWKLSTESRYENIALLIQL